MLKKFNLLVESIKQELELEQLKARFYYTSEFLFNTLTDEEVIKLSEECDKIVTEDLQKAIKNKDEIDIHIYFMNSSFAGFGDPNKSIKDVIYHNISINFFEIRYGKWHCSFSYKDENDKLWSYSAYVDEILTENAINFIKQKEQEFKNKK